MRKTCSSAKVFVQQRVERLGAGQIAAEGLFDDDPLPALAVGVLLVLAERFDDRREGVGRRGKIEQPVAGGAELLVVFLERIVQLRVIGLGAVIAADIERGVLDPLPDGLIHRLGAGELLHRLAALLAVLLVGHLRSRIADQDELVRQHLLPGQLVDGGNQLPLGQVAAGPEDHEGTGRSRGHGITFRLGASVD